MSKLFHVLAMTAIASAISPAQADEPSCPSGTNTTPITGVINNNAVDYVRVSSGVLPITLGVAHLDVGGSPYTCTVHGSPNIRALSNNFYHRIVCDDHSELSFLTGFIGANIDSGPLQAVGLCENDVVSYFHEESVPDTSQTSKGLFTGVEAGKLDIIGCVINHGSDTAPDIELEMLVTDSSQLCM